MAGNILICCLKTEISRLVAKPSRMQCFVFFVFIPGLGTWEVTRIKTYVYEGKCDLLEQRYVNMRKKIFLFAII